MQVFRIREATGEKYFPAETKDGRFQLADPSIGEARHHAEHAIFADTIHEAMELVTERGFSLWMKGQNTKQRNLIAADQIKVAGENND